jgi:hypothetical protein
MDKISQEADNPLGLSKNAPHFMEHEGSLSCSPERSHFTLS